MNYCAAISPVGPPRLHGDSNIVAARLSFGDAVRIGSTPVSKVIAVGAEFALPSVATTITASSFFRSPTVTAGIRLNIC